MRADRPLICQRCECPLPPHRFVKTWPLNGRQCGCRQPLTPLPIDRYAFNLIAEYSGTEKTSS